MVWCSFLTAFGVATVQPISSEHVIGIEPLFVAVQLAREDAFGVLLGIVGRFLGLEVASCLLGAFLGTFLESTEEGRKFIYLAQVVWQ